VQLLVSEEDFCFVESFDSSLIMTMERIMQCCYSDLFLNCILFNEAVFYNTRQDREKWYADIAGEM
jgi:hypothetical protein